MRKWTVGSLIDALSLDLGTRVASRDSSDSDGEETATQYPGTSVRNAYTSLSVFKHVLFSLLGNILSEYRESLGNAVLLSMITKSDLSFPRQ